MDTTQSSRCIPTMLRSASDAGSGQSGSGTETNLPAALTDTPVAMRSGSDTPIAHDEHLAALIAGGGQITMVQGTPQPNMDQFDNLALRAGSIAATGASVAQAIEAAISQNGQSAPSDPILIAVQGMHQRLNALESTVAPLVEISRIVPGAGNIADRVATVENTVEQLAQAAETTAPLLSRIMHLFNVHFGGKLGSV